MLALSIIVACSRVFTMLSNQLETRQIFHFTVNQFLDWREAWCGWLCEFHVGGRTICSSHFAGLLSGIAKEKGKGLLFVLKGIMLLLPLLISYLTPNFVALVGIAQYLEKCAMSAKVFYRLLNVSICVLTMCFFLCIMLINLILNLLRLAVYICIIL